MAFSQVWPDDFDKKKGVREEAQLPSNFWLLKKETRTFYFSTKVFISNKYT